MEPTPDPTAATEGAHRLPRNVEPRRYRLTLAPDLGAATFTGTAEIEVTVHEPTHLVVLNAADLLITDASFAPSGGPAVPATVTLDEAAERATFALSTAVPSGPATLHCRFEGVLNDKLRGFYRSTFTDPSGATRTIATTQMESTDARRAFPCWDEPDRKAVFEVTLVVDDGLAAFSNSPVVDEAPVAGTTKRSVRFAPTMKMSTYLVAFVVGPLEATDPVDVEGVPVRVVHAPGKGGLTAFALEVGAHALRFFTDYFGIAYPGDKLDLVAIPDFAFGAMENLGCVTFRESALLVDPKGAARTELERVADVVCHEIAHMWFGDLVTMGWWEGIWLNEAFATFMEVLCVDAFRPAWRRWVSFGLEREAALAVDGLHATRPIEYPVASPDEADGMFDVLTYQKGGSVLRMLERYLGAEVFRDGVRRYLGAHAYANTVTADLWDALEEVSGQPVRAVMDSWILQGGHPLVTVGADTLTQSPFSYAPSAAGALSAIGAGWQVPVLVRPLDGGPLERLLLGEEPAPRPAGEVVNAGGWGVYRLCYDDLGALAGRLGDLDPLERFNLFADTWALVLSGRAELGRFFDLAAGLGGEEEPAIYSVVTGTLGLCDRVATDDERPAVQAAARALLSRRAGELGWDPKAGEGERVPTLRALLLSSLGTVGADASVRAEAARRFDGAAPADPDTEGAVLASVAAQLRPGDYETVLDRYRHPATPQEELRYLNALAAFPDAQLGRRTFELARTEVRTQNAPYLVGGLLANRVAGPAVWEEVKAAWGDLLERFPLNSHSRMLDGARGLCAEPAVAADVERFLTDHPIPSGQRSVAQTVERLGVNAAFARRHRGRLAGVLAPLAAQDRP
jgi:puromycin-sensitive aminopeptidase